MSLIKGRCSVCGGVYTLRRDGTVRQHGRGGGSQYVGCEGGTLPPAPNPARFEVQGDIDIRKDLKMEDWVSPINVRLDTLQEDAKALLVEIKEQQHILPLADAQRLYRRLREIEGWLQGARQILWPRAMGEP